MQRLSSIKSLKRAAKILKPMISHLTSKTRTEMAFAERPNPTSKGISVSEALSRFDEDSSEEFLKELIASSSTSEAALADQIPLPSEADREGYYEGQPYLYWLFGFHDYNNVRTHVDDIPRNGRILDFGGSSGRVMRHFANNHPEMEVIVAERFLSAVEFINNYFPSNAYALPVFSQPHLALEDNSCDLVTAFSVFTHIDNEEIAWLSELRRILKKGGIAYLTIHSEHTWSNLEGTVLEGLIRACPTFDSTMSFNEDMPGDRIVFQPRGFDQRGINVFHSSEYIKRIWGRILKIRKLIPAGHGNQTVVMLEKIEQ